MQALSECSAPVQAVLLLAGVFNITAQCDYDSVCAFPVQNQSAPTEPSHAELVLRADAAGEHIGATATHGPASTTSITPAHLCDDEDLSFSHLGSKQRLPGSPANDHSNGSAVRLAKDIDMDLFHPPGSQAQHRPLMTAVFNQQPAGANFRRYLNAPPQRTASMPLLGGSESSIPLPRTSSRRREKNCRLAQYDDPSNMELADEYAQEIGSTARPACSHSGSKGGKATSAATSKLRRQRDSDGLENTSGDSDVSTGARTPNGHERRAHRTSANLSTLGPHHHVSPHAADADHAMHVVPTGNGMKLPFKENLEADAHSWAEPLQAKQESQQQVDPSPRTLPQSIPYISAPILSTHTASYVAHGSSAGSSIEDVQYLSIHPLLPFAMTLPLPFQPSAPFPGARESPPTLGSLVPSASLLPGHMSFHSPQLQQLPPVSQQQQQPNLLWQPYPSQPSSHTQVYEERSSIPEPPTPSTCTPSDSQTSTVTPQPRLIAPCRSRGPSVRSGGGILDVAETSIYGHGT